MSIQLFSLAARADCPSCQSRLFPSCSSQVTTKLLRCSLRATTTMRVASPTVLRLSFSARNVYRRPLFLAGCPRCAALQPVTGPVSRNWIHLVFCCRLLDGPAQWGERVSELNPKHTPGSQFCAPCRLNRLLSWLGGLRKPTPAEQVGRLNEIPLPTDCRGGQPSHLTVRKRRDAMSRSGKSLWPEDARRLYPLELAQRPRVGRPGGAVGLNMQELLVYHEFVLRARILSANALGIKQKEFEHRAWPHTISRGISPTFPKILPCRKAQLHPNLCCEGLRIHTEKPRLNITLVALQKLSVLSSLFTT